MLRKRIAEGFALRLEFAGGTTLAFKSSGVSAVRVDVSPVWTTFKSMFSRFLAWSFRPGSLFLCARNARVKHAIVFGCVWTRTPRRSFCGGIAALRNRGPVCSTGLLGVLALSYAWHFDA